MCKYAYEYRINKKGAECFRTDSLEKCKAKLEELNAKRPGIYTMQSRSRRIDRYGVKEHAQWSIWR